jgi:hypothetical protein
MTRISSDLPSVVQTDHASAGYINDKGFCQSQSAVEEAQRCYRTNHRQQLMHDKAYLCGRYLQEQDGGTEQQH